MDIWEEKKDILSLLPEELEAEFVAMGEQKFRAGQVFQWLSRGVRDFDEMSNLSKSLRGKLKERYFLYAPKVLSKQVSAIDGTIKYLWELRDGNAVETVVMSYKHGNTVCVSSQVGCRQGCAFCASTIGGLVRGLLASEILDEVLFSELDSGKKISNIVLMGIGEPLDNYDNVMRFLRLVNHPKGLNIGMRHISLSTCEERHQNIIFVQNNRHMIIFEIDFHRSFLCLRGLVLHRWSDNIVLPQVNDSSAQARLLAKHARAVAAHVNLIPLNHVEERQFQPSTPEHMKNFIQILEDAGVNVTVRRRLGSDVDASCGQLRRKMQAQNKGKGGSAEA